MAAEPIALSTGSNLTQMSSNWVAATFYVGAARLARVSDDPETLRFLSVNHAAVQEYGWSREAFGFAAFRPGQKPKG